MKTKVILWDIDGTLLNQKVPERNAIRAAYRHFGLGEVTEEDLDKYPEINDRWWKWCEEGRYPKSRILWGRHEELLSVLGRDTSKAQDVANYYMEHLCDTICFYPHAEETIKATKEKVKQYVVTNGAKLSQEGKLRTSHIQDFMDGVFISEELGFEKPSIEFFQKVFETIGDYDKEEILIVGDSLTTDMRGGNNAGIRCCWYNIKGKKAPADLNIAYEITDLREVLTLLDEE